MIMTYQSMTQAFPLGTVSTLLHVYTEVLLHLVYPRVQLLHSIQIIAKQKGNLEHTYMYPTTDHYSYTHVTQTEGRFVPLHHLAGTTYSKAIVGDDLAEFGLSLGAYICIIPHRAPTEK